MLNSAEDRAEALFEAWLGAREDGRPTEFAALLAEHPELADELTACHEGWTLLEEHAESTLPGPLLPGELVLGESRLPGAARRAELQRTPLRSGDTLGEFKLLRELGQGGMGSVWEAEQTTLGRRVALKLLRPGRESALAIERLLVEARAAGRADHPGLVAVFAAGEADGHHYIAQQLVGEGRSLVDLIDELRDEPLLGTDDYRKLAVFFRDVARAVHAAHEAGVLHRDLKPQNILLGADERPRVSDFGLAHLDEGGDAARPGLVGTYAYMSPEQVEDGETEIDRRTDVFGLGAVLYEALTQRRAFDGDTAEQILRQVREIDPPDPRVIRSRVPEDLALICQTAMEKSRAKRYASMAAFADDLQRFLDHQPIVARPQRFAVRAGKWTRRHPGQATALVVGSLALIAISILLVREVSARKDAETEKDRADLLAVEAQQNADLAESRAEALSRQSYVSNMLAAGTSLERGEHAAARALLAAGDPTLRGFEYAQLALRADSSIARWSAHDGAVTAACLSADGTSAFTAGVDGKVFARKLVDDTAPAAAQFLHDAGAPISALALLGETLAVGTDDGRVLVLDAETGALRTTIAAHDGVVTSLRLHPFGGALLSAGADGTWATWSLEDGALLRRVEASAARLLALDLDASGQLLATLSEQGTLRLWETETGALLHTLAWYERRHLDVALSPDGRWLWAAGRDGQLDVWEILSTVDEEGPILADVVERRGRWRVHAHAVSALAVSADGRRLLTASAVDNALCLWDPETRAELVQLTGHDGPLRALALDATGARALVANGDGSALVWDGGLRGASIARLVPGAAPTSLAVDGGGRRLLSASINERVAQLWDGRRGRVLAELGGHAGGVTDLDLTRDGRLGVTGSYDGTARVWSGEDGRLLNVLRGHGSGVTALALDATGTRLAVGSYDGRVRLWAPERGELLSVLDLGGAPLADLDLSADASTLLLGRTDGRVELWREGALLRTLQQPVPAGDGSVAISADGRRAAWAALDTDLLRLWDTGTGELLVEQRGFGSGLIGLALDAEGRRVLGASSGDNALRLRDAATGTQLLQLDEHASDLSAFAMSDDGALLLSADRDGELRLWPGDREHARELWAANGGG